VWHNRRTLPQDSRAKQVEVEVEAEAEAEAERRSDFFLSLDLSLNLFNILLDLHRLGYVVERRFGDLAGPAAAFCHDVVQVRGIFAQARARVPHRRHAFHDSIGDEFLAIDTADGGCPAFGINLLLNHRQ